MGKTAGLIIVILGAVLLIAALLLFLYNQNEDLTAGQEAESLLQQIQVHISQKTETESTEETEPTEGTTEESTPPLPTEPTQDPEMPVVELDGYGYIGYLSIPDLELQLPVMAEWDNARLKISPCRQFGSTRTDDLVIAAHNYKRHFGNLKNLALGAAVTFTDMDGVETRYTLCRLETLSPTAVDAVQNSGFDLVLYTCTIGGQTRVAAFCDRAE